MTTGTQPSRRASAVAGGRLPAVLVVAMGIGPLTTYGITALSPLVVSDLGVSRAELGAVATTCFTVAALTSLGAARATATFGSRAVLIAQFVAAAVAVATVAAAHSLLWLLVGVGISGFAQSLSNPATNDLVSRYVPERRRGTIIGLKQSGVQMSQFVAGLSLPVLALAIGWRPAIAASGAVAVIGLILSGSVPPRADPAHRRTGRRCPRAGPLPPVMWWMVAYTALMAAALQATNVYLPLFAYQRLHLSSAVAGLTVAVVGGVGLVARIVWGRLSGRSEDPRRIMFWMSIASAGVLALLVCAQLPNCAWLLWPGVALDGATAIASNVIVIVSMIRWFRPAHVSRASGVLAFGMYLGFAVGPLGFGLGVDLTSGYTPAFCALAVLYLAAAVTAARWRGAGKPTPHPA